MPSKLGSEERGRELRFWEGKNYVAYIKRAASYVVLIIQTSIFIFIMLFNNGFDMEPASGAKPASAVDYQGWKHFLNAEVYPKGWREG